jgi:phage shock protein A
MATVNAKLENLQQSLDDVKESLKALTEGHATTREFRAETMRRLDDCERDRRDLWGKVNEAQSKATSADSRAESAHLWLKIACAGFGGALIALASALLHK